MAFSIENRLGLDLNNTFLATFYGVSPLLQRPPHRAGDVAEASDGKLYVFSQAGGAIPASTAVCTVSPSTFQATATGGAYTSPATAMSTGDYGWFGKANV